MTVQQIGKTTVQQSMHGAWYAETWYRVDDKITLKVYTSKGFSKKIATSVYGGVAEIRTSMASFTFSPHTDYYHRVDHGAGRLTEKSVREFHNSVDIAPHIEAAIAHYKGN